MEGRLGREGGKEEEENEPRQSAWRERMGADGGGWRRGKGGVVSDELGTER